MRYLFISARSFSLIHCIHSCFLFVRIAELGCQCQSEAKAFLISAILEDWIWKRRFQGMNGNIKLIKFHLPCEAFSAVYARLSFMTFESNGSIENLSRKKTFQTDISADEDEKRIWDKISGQLSIPNIIYEWSRAVQTRDWDYWRFFGSVAAEKATHVDVRLLRCSAKKRRRMESISLNLLN